MRNFSEQIWGDLRERGHAARFMRMDFFTFTPSHTLVVATNHRPAVNSTEHAAWRRLRLVPFPHTYRPPTEASDGDRVQDPALRRRLVVGTDQREALLAWIVRGAIDWHHDGLGVSSTVTHATAGWRAGEDVILRFVQERLDLEAGTETRGQALFDTYTTWCLNEGRKPKSNKNFSRELLDHEEVRAANVTRITRQNVAFYEGVKVRDTPAF